MSPSRAQEFVDAGLRARLRVDLLDDHGAVQLATVAARRKAAGDDDRSARHAAIADSARRAVEDLRALPEEHAHAEHRVLLDDHAFDHFRAGTAEAVVLKDR